MNRYFQFQEVIYIRRGPWEARLEIFMPTVKNKMFLLNEVFGYPEKLFSEGNRKQQALFSLIDPVKILRVHQIERKPDSPRSQQLLEGNFENIVPSSGLISEPSSLREVLHCRNDQGPISCEVVAVNELNNLIYVIIENEFDVVLSEPFRISFVKNHRAGAIAEQSVLILKTECYWNLLEFECIPNVQ